MWSIQVGQGNLPQSTKLSTHPETTSVIKRVLCTGFLQKHYKRLTAMSGQRVSQVWTVTGCCQQKGEHRLAQVPGATVTPGDRTEKTVEGLSHLTGGTSTWRCERMSFFAIPPLRCAATACGRSGRVWSSSSLLS